MPSPDWGKKHLCLECASKFYDFGKDVPLCPNCGAKAPPEKPRKPVPQRRPNRTTFNY